MVTGYAEDDGFPLNRGFIYDPVTGSYPDIIAPGAVQIIAQGINKAHQVVGSAAGAAIEAFLRDPATGPLPMYQIQARRSRAAGNNKTWQSTGSTTAPHRRHAPANSK